MRDDVQVVTRAVLNDGLSLQHASARLRDDRNVVLAAVSVAGHALLHASDRLRGDADVVFKAVTGDTEWADNKDPWSQARCARRTDQSVGLVGETKRVVRLVDAQGAQAEKTNAKVGQTIQVEGGSGVPSIFSNSPDGNVGFKFAPPSGAHAEAARQAHFGPVAEHLCKVRHILVWL